MKRVNFHLSCVHESRSLLYVHTEHYRFDWRAHGRERREIYFETMRTIIKCVVVENSSIFLLNILTMTTTSSSGAAAVDARTWHFCWWHRMQCVQKTVSSSCWILGKNAFRSIPRTKPTENCLARLRRDIVPPRHTHTHPAHFNTLVEAKMHMKIIRVVVFLRCSR